MVSHGLSLEEIECLANLHHRVEMRTINGREMVAITICDRYGYGNRLSNAEYLSFILLVSKCTVQRDQQANSRLIHTKDITTK